MGVRYGVMEETARLFIQKAREAMASSGNCLMDGEVHVDEFVLGGREEGKTGRRFDSKKKKTVTTVQLTMNGKAKRMYAKRINDFSAQSLQYNFVNQISREANVTTYEWGRYRLIAKVYNIVQIKNKGLNFKAFHTMIYKVKS